MYLLTRIHCRKLMYMSYLLGETFENFISAVTRQDCRDYKYFKHL